jgi:hypothetical protein
MERESSLEAAERLGERLRGFPWFVSTGVGRLEDGADVIFLYVKSLRHPQLKALASGWMGYNVLVRQTGSPRPFRGVVTSHCGNDFL